MTATLSPAELTKLVGILSRLESPFDGERAAAALLASRMLRRHGLGWKDLIVPSTVRVPSFHQPCRPEGRIADIDFALAHIDQLSTWEREFLTSIGDRVFLSIGQRRKLSEIVKKLRQADAA
jgi:hypothetical protein